MESSPFKTFLAGLTIVVSGLFMVLIATTRMPTNTLLHPTHRVRVETDSLAFFGPNLTSALFWVAPSDDLVYIGNAPEPLMNHGDFVTYSSALGELLITGQRLLLQRDLLAWHVTTRTSPIRDAIYVVSNESGGRVRIRRTLEQLPGPARAVGQAIRYCDQCQVRADGGGFALIDPAGDRLATVPAPPGSEASLSRVDHVIEFKTPIKSDRPAELSQDIQFAQP